MGLLVDSGYEVRVAFDGAEGLDVLADWPADLVVLDLIMPRVDGCSFLTALTMSPGSARPLVLVWSVADTAELDRARSLGATDCLARSATAPRDLLSTIARLLDARTSENPSAI